MTSLRSLLPASVQTARLTGELFDPTNSAHVQLVLAVFNDPQCTAIMGDFGLRTAEQLLALEAKLRLGAAAFPRPTAVDCGVIYLMRLEGAGLIGNISICQRSARIAPDIGAGFLPQHWGRGYAAESGAAVYEAFVAATGCREVIAWPGADNKQSQRVCVKAGLVDGGTVTDQDGRRRVVYVKPGMKIPEGLSISFYGDD